MSANDELQNHTCEKILQECGDVANNVAQGKVQDLTEQWKKGELEQGWYYVLLFSNEEYITFIDGNWVVDDRLIGADIKEVVAPVPSYDHFVELTEKVKENQQLKELLLSSRGFVDKERITLETSGFGHNEYCRRTKELLTAIDNVIGENK